MCFCTILGRLRLDAEGGHLRSQLGIIAGGFAPPPGVLSQGYVGGVGAATAVRRQERGPLETLTDEDRPSRPTSLFVAPNGAVFAPPSLRTGVLPRMLQEILDTRVMVKAAAARPDVAGDPVMRRVMTARQLALKMIANVTYGYTAAGFSGRMPCADLADAIVSAGRSTLQRAIALVEGRPAWGARVVYGGRLVLCLLSFSPPAVKLPVCRPQETRTPFSSTSQAAASPRRSASAPRLPRRSMHATRGP